MSNYRTFKVTADLPAYMSSKKRMYRAKAIANGVCVHCFTDEARTGLRTCQGCADASSARKAARL
jgi:hypothetical protein